MLTEEDMLEAIEEVKPSISEIVKKTKRKKVEHGFSICVDDNEGYDVGVLCSGGERRCELRGCREGQRTIGSVHTHPSGSILPTPEDVTASFREHETFFCIANPKGLTRCWKIAEWNDNLKDLLNLTAYDTALPEWERQFKGGGMITEDLLFERGKILKQIAEFEV